MTALGTVGYGVTALGFLVLTVLLATSHARGRTGRYLMLASLATSVWATLLAIQSHAVMPLLPLYFAEVARHCGWLLALAAIAEGMAPRKLILLAKIACVALLAAPFALSHLAQLGWTLDHPSLLLSRAGLAASLLGLVLLEQVYRNSPSVSRPGLKFFAAGLGAMLIYDLFLYSQAELLREIGAFAWNGRALVTVLAVPLLVIAARHTPDWAPRMFVSRQVVFYSTSFLAVGIYLLLMALGGYYFRQVGGSWGVIVQGVFFVGAAIVLATFLISPTLKKHTQVFIAKHFYRNKYDYRIEWLRFIETLSSTDENDIRRTAIRAIAQIFDSPGGVLFLADERERRFVAVGAWPMRLESLDVPGVIAADAELVQFIQRRKWIIDLREYRESPDVYDNIALPEWLHTSGALRIVSPLLELQKLYGFVVLYDPPPPFDLTYEDRDLLKTVGRHVATQLAQHEADRHLAQSRQFEAYNKLTAFMMHDLKNSVAQLQLIVANSAKHKRNPAFVDDAIDTIDNTVERMTRLIDQLRRSGTDAPLQKVRLDDLVRNTVDRCSLRAPAPELTVNTGAVIVSGDPQQLSAVVEHVIRNAQDAAGIDGVVSVGLSSSSGTAVLVVTDNGKGMDAEFVRERLFRPFDSTKGSKGMGIGAYQTREYVHSLGGRVEVQSSPGQGTSFSITLPLEPSHSELPVADTV